MITSAPIIGSVYHPNDRGDFCVFLSFWTISACCSGQDEIEFMRGVLNWKVAFNKAGAATKVEIEISFESVEHLQKIVEMGFQEGFAAAHNNLDELLAA